MKNWNKDERCDVCRKYIGLGKKIAQNNRGAFIHECNEKNTSVEWKIHNENDPITVDPKTIYLWIIYELENLPQHNEKRTFLKIHKLISIIFQYIQENDLEKYFTRSYVQNKDEIHTNPLLGNYYRSLQRDLETDFATSILKFLIINGERSDFYLHNVLLTETGKELLFAKVERLKRKLGVKRFNKLQEKILEICRYDEIKIIEEARKKERCINQKTVDIFKTNFSKVDIQNKKFVFLALLPSASLIEVNNVIELLKKEYITSYQITEKKFGYELKFKKDYFDDWKQNVIEIKKNGKIEKLCDDDDPDLKSLEKDFQDNPFQFKIDEEGLILIEGNCQIKNRTIIQRQLVEFCYSVIYVIEDMIMTPNIADVDKRTGSGLLYYKMSFENNISSEFTKELEAYLKKLDEDIFDIFNISLIHLQNILNEKKRWLPLIYHAFKNTKRRFPNFQEDYSILDKSLHIQKNTRRLLTHSETTKFKSLLDILQIRAFRTSVNFLLFSKTIKRLKITHVKSESPQTQSNGNVLFDEKELKKLENFADTYSVNFDFAHNGLTTTIRLYASLLGINGIVIALLVSSFIIFTQVEWEYWWKLFSGGDSNPNSFSYFFTIDSLRLFFGTILQFIGWAGLIATPMSRMKKAVDGFSRTFNITPPFHATRRSKVKNFFQKKNKECICSKECKNCNSIRCGCS
ncbi:hypothetical protein YTPLAS73_04110 [Nitrosarchaeum sp.]|nr:hypothetical protein YTPLAS73_04110 [Nitrosarchaeum sp.]